MKFTHAFFDLDGTVYVDGVVIPGVLEGLNALKRSGTKVFYMTNNTSVSLKDYYEKLVKLGLPVENDSVISPTLTLASWLKKSAFNSYFSVGTSAFGSELSLLSGKKHCATDAQLVVVAFDRELNYQKLSKACELINSGVPWVVTHIDLACPSLNGPIPDCGSIARLIASATGVDYSDDFGKPSKHMYDLITDISFCSKNILVAGDRLYTDIRMGVDLSATTIAVCTGEYKRSSPFPFKRIEAQVYETLADYLLELS
jgi:4-nitrophenyl phosphatase